MAAKPSRLDRYAVPTAVLTFSRSPDSMDTTLTSADIERRPKYKVAADEPEVY